MRLSSGEVTLESSQLETVTLQMSSESLFIGERMGGRGGEDGRGGDGRQGWGGWEAGVGRMGGRGGDDGREGWGWEAGVGTMGGVGWEAGVGRMGGRGGEDGRQGWGGREVRECARNGSWLCLTSSPLHLVLGSRQIL